MAPASAAPAASSASAASAPPKGQVRFWQSDLPMRDRKAVLDAVRATYARHLGGGKADGSKAQVAERWRAFARSMQASLNGSALGTQWSVVVGETLGFACKKRIYRVATFRVDGVTILAWRSPGIEEPELEEPPAAAAAADADGNGDQDAAAAATRAVKLRVLEPRDGDKARGSEGAESNAGVVEALRSTLGAMAAADAEDVQKVALRVRKRLTADFGTIWHVIAGQKLLVVQEPAEASNVVRVSVEAKQPMHIVCYQHSQFEKATIDFDKLLKALPYLGLVLLCFTYMTLHSVCNQEPAPDHRFRWMLRRNLCVENWEGILNAIGIITLVAFFVSKKAHLFFPKSKKKD
eukprot:TRINITY_DN32323_c0_g1_i1.p1 TRINITY_DN32323_c0_g1~~TRINITY_DN32323_c0_g1_i1.p1  ORF type:complete len:371 (-),score=101.10 TRINITY_DN32323_c0_g1_i1:50-1099(-)